MYYPRLFELIATGSSPLSRVHNDLALSPLSNTSPTAVAFAKARAERFFRLPSDANERSRGYMQRQVQECKNVNSIGWVGPSRHGNTNVVGIVGVGTSSDKDVPRPSDTGARRLALDTFSTPPTSAVAQAHISFSQRGGSSVDEPSSFLETRIQRDQWTKWVLPWCEG
ncbi:hypothetical protein M405DRAFT_810773 [Rhizopogon salebrosus TDB-379]|nr:hypothetical protein M405DRAFT_810773 [Rhizopogon salebrosus TDB-379]